MSKVSVVIPVKDREEKLKRAIKSVLEQTHKNIEVIVVENNSIDPESILNMAGSYPDENVNFYSVGECDNANYARNFGLRESTGDYIAFLDSDDEYMPNHIEDCLKLIKQSGAEFLYGSIFIDDGFGRTVKLARQIKNESGFDYLFGKNSAWAPTPTYLLDSKVLECIEWDVNLRRHQDYDFFINVCKEFNCVAKLEPSVIVHWLKSEKRSYDSKSFRSFYKKWKGDMSSYNIRRYNIGKIRLSIKRLDFINLFYFSVNYLVSFFK